MQYFTLPPAFRSSNISIGIASKPARDVGHLEQVHGRIRAVDSVEATRSEIVLSTLIRRVTA